MPSGILVIDKPAGWTSMDVCAKLRGVFHEKRVGHSGTLDPMATGVLPIFIGRATRAVEFAEKSDKEYIAGLKLGVITNTQDTTGEVLETRPVQIGREQLERALEGFRGDIMQIPPMFSAIKINGKKLYELARKGREVERPARPVTIKALELLGQQGEDLYTIRVRCTKGTYIRALCHDIGQALGCGGCMASLRRTMAAGFTLKDAVSMEQLQTASDPASLLLPVDCLFAGRPVLMLKSAEVEKKVRNGMTAVLPGLAPGEYRVYSQDGIFLALCQAQGGKLTTIKSFFEV
ncbi:tRNA pseudouridine(55) synthase TruB [Colidextribacter sp. OB.20]|uniref:tRNA pseudouridine(55) synthase TruB n=1 Tax=Colidextribacter sp. OB.20 TaxID=2304568 RepID=UPI00136B5431|nr:tRNA pseudouridine(55) synthase TruB [Colidextribacter sp. OB.20]NBI10978.1 tRNA pseudouridine(55) synthase TruB [Colidextribacter sp. OB.20]